MPSVAATEPSFDPDFATGAIFRGSSWINLNWYLAWGLQERGFTDVAEELIRRTVAMAARSGMRECYGPYDAAGQGAESFGWSTLVLDLIPDLIPDLVHTGQAAARARAGEDFVVHCDAASARSARSMEPSS